MKTKKRMLMIAVTAIVALLLLPVMAVVAHADGPKTGGPGDELVDDTTVTATIQATLITTITSAVDFGDIPAGVPTEMAGSISANVRGNVVYNMDVHGLGDFAKGLDTMPISCLEIRGGDLGVYTPMTLVVQGISLLANEPVPGSDLGVDYSFDLQMTPPSNAPAGTYDTTLRFTTYQ